MNNSYIISLKDNKLKLSIFFFSGIPNEELPNTKPIMRGSVPHMRSETLPAENLLQVYNNIMKIQNKGGVWMYNN